MFDVVEIPRGDYVTEMTFNLVFEISLNRFGGCDKREGSTENPAVAERFLDFYGLIFAGLREDKNERLVAFR